MKSMPKQLIVSFLKQILFWFIVFDFTRIVFIIINFGYLKGTGFIHTLGVFWYSIPLDLSATCYIMVLPFFILTVQNFYSAKWLNILNKSYVVIILILIAIVTSAEAGIYGEWKTKLHYKALLYLAHPDEIAASAQLWQVIAIPLISFFEVVIFFFLYRKVFFTRIVFTRRHILFSILFILLAPLILFYGMRGSFMKVPINQSQSYYSRYETLNWISVNSLWNLGSSIKRNYNMLKVNPYHYYSDNDAFSTVKEIFSARNDSTEHLLKTPRPNIVMFILEGWSADLIESLGGEKGITPFFHELEKNGVLFTNIYTNGTRSQEGMTGIFSGFPAQTITTLTQQPEKYHRLPSLIKNLRGQGYYSSFYFGGELVYGNIKSYLVFNGFDKLLEEKDLHGNFPHAKLGVHDEYTFPYFLKEIGKQKEPFFSSIFTMSTHSPYDFIMEEKIHWPQYEKKYVNAAYYTDNCIKNFFTEAKKEKWYNNTLFVLVSDHSHGSYRNHHFCSPDYHKIVMLLCGNVIRDNYKGTQVSKVGSQTDLPAIILAQLGIDYSGFSWSKNLLQPACPEFAFYAYDDGFGWVRPGAYFTFEARTNADCMLKIDSTAKITKAELVRQAKSYMQCSFQQYMDF